MDSSASDKSKLTSSPMQDQNIPTAFKSESSLACQIEQIEGTLKSIYLAYLSTSLAFVSNSLRLKFNLSEVYPASTLPKNHRRSDVPQTRLETIYTGPVYTGPVLQVNGTLFEVYSIDQDS